MKKVASLVVVVTLLAVAALAGGCGSKDKSSGGTVDQGLKGKITIAGSTSVQPFSEVLAEDFMAENPNVKINVQGGGSSQGIAAVQSGAADIGASSRDLKPEEKGLHEFVIARDGIAVVVNPGNKIDNLTMEQLRDIFAGKITNWKQVGGTDNPITVVTREAGSGTRDGFEHLVMNKTEISSKALVCNSTGAVKSTVASDRNAIGYMSMASVDKSVKTVTVDGIPCSPEKILNGEYKISRPFIYLTKEEPSGVVKSFVDFVLSERGQEILKNEGVVPIK